MSRLLRTLFLVFFIGSCGVLSYGSAPRNLDNACSILQQRPHFHRAFKSAQQSWGVPINVQMAMIHQESRFRSNAKTPMRYFLGILPRGRQSSAYGYAQALDGTWNEYKKSTSRMFARRSNIRDAADFMGWYMTETKRRNRISLSNAKSQYLAYHEGQTGYSRGSYRKKAWLLKVANKVERRSSMYRRQLKGCGRL